MTNLTEQWKKGKLPSGRYWVKMSYQGAIIPLYYSEDYGFEYDDHFYDFEEISEVLAEVPSFEQWIMTKNLSERAHLEMYKARGKKVKLEKENAKLKELLKEVQSKIRYSSPRGIETFADLDDTLLGKINQVLGEE